MKIIWQRITAYTTHLFQTLHRKRMDQKIRTATALPEVKATKSHSPLFLKSTVFIKEVDTDQIRSVFTL